MKQIRFQRNMGGRGFTLIEILIVAALIALFSSIAIISMQYVATQSKRKASVADARSLSDAMTIAHMEFRFYPKLCYLSRPRIEIQRLVNGQQQILPDFDAMGFDKEPERILAGRSREVLQNWGGPYFPSPAGRGGTGNARSGVCKMRLPYQPSDTPVGDLYDWPADPWGNPYVVYLAGTAVDPADGIEKPSFVSTPFQEPTYFARVVSYGPNGIPGGSAVITEGLPSGSLGQIRVAAEPYKLYKTEGTHFVALLPTEYEGPPHRLYALHAPAQNQTEGYLMNTAFAGKVPGIMDPGSDDLSVPLH